MSRTTGKSANCDDQQTSTYEKKIPIKCTTCPDKFLLQIKAKGESIKAAKIEGIIGDISQLEKALLANSWKEAVQTFSSVPSTIPLHLQAAIALTTEKILKEPPLIPQRATDLRMIALEFERIANHLSFIRRLLEPIGHPSLSLKVTTSLREAEKALKIFHPDKNNPFIILGGVAFDITLEQLTKLSAILSLLLKTTRKLRRKLRLNPILRNHFKEVGFVPRDIIKNLSLSGPIARASGITCDVRKTDPYLEYNKTSFVTPIADSCDLLGEIIVRVEEITESSLIVRQLLKRSTAAKPEAEIEAEAFETNVRATISDQQETQAKSVITRLETPDGELFCFAINQKGTLGASSPKLFKLTLPSKANSQAVIARLSGETIDNLALLAQTIV